MSLLIHFSCHVSRDRISATTLPLSYYRYTLYMYGYLTKSWPLADASRDELNISACDAQL